MGTDARTTGRASPLALLAPIGPMRAQPTPVRPSTARRRALDDSTPPAVRITWRIGPGSLRGDVPDRLAELLEQTGLPCALEWIVDLRALTDPAPGHTIAAARLYSDRAQQHSSILTVRGSRTHDDALSPLPELLRRGRAAVTPELGTHAGVVGVDLPALLTLSFRLPAAPHPHTQNHAKATHSLPLLYARTTLLDAIGVPGGLADRPELAALPGSDRTLSE